MPRIFTARKRSLGQGNIFTNVCHSVHGGGGCYDVTSCSVMDSTSLPAGQPPPTASPRTAPPTEQTVSPSPTP